MLLKFIWKNISLSQLGNLFCLIDVLRVDWKFFILKKIISSLRIV